MAVIYVQFLPECEIAPGRQATLGDMAHLSPADAALLGLKFDVPEKGRRVDAVEAAARISEARPDAEVSVLGSGEIFVARPRHRTGPLSWLLKACLLALLFFGAALGITFFHADVNMREAQRALYEMLGGAELAPLELAVPYALGIFLGVGGFFLLGGRKKSPLALKLQTYRKQLEQAEEMSAKK